MSSHDHWDEMITHYLKTTSPQQLLFSWKLSAIIIFKLCKFSVNLWTLCFLSYKSYKDPLRRKWETNEKSTRWTNIVNVTPFNHRKVLKQAVRRAVKSWYKTKKQTNKQTNSWSKMFLDCSWILTMTAEQISFGRLFQSDFTKHH